MPFADSLRRELPAVARLAGPVVAVQLGIMLMGVVDTMMLGRLSAAALAAGALGHAFSIGILMFGSGVLMALDPLVAQAHGADDRAAIAGHLERGVLMALALAVVLSVPLWDAGPLFLMLGQQPAVAEGAAAYARAIVPGAPAFLLFVAARQTLQAMSVVRPAVVAIVAGNLVNVAGNWALIYGRLGAPALGVQGSALSTSLARWTVLLALVVAGRRALAPYWRGLTREATSLPHYWRKLRLGVPIGAQLILEIWVFTIVAFMMGALGVEELAGHQIAINLASLSYMVPLGISAAAATRVGNAIGRQDTAGALLAARVCLGLGTGVMAGFGLLFWAAPRALAGLYSEDPAVLAMAAALLPIAAAFQVFDGCQVVCLGVLRGIADTRSPTVITVVGYWLVGLPVAWWLGGPGGWGPRGLWWGLTAGLAAAAALLLARIATRFRREIAPLAA